MHSYDYIEFLNQKVLENLPSSNFIRVGNQINMKCPICGDSKKSASKKRGSYYFKTASYYCFNCNTSLSGIKFLEFISGQNYKDIKKEYFKMMMKSGFKPNFSQLSSFDDPNIFQFKSILKPEWKKPLSDKAKDYLNSRLVLSAPFLKEDLYSCYNSKGEEYIMIPWRINGIDAFFQLHDFQKLHSLKYIFPKDKKKLVYGLDNIDISWPYIIVFEGVFDSLFVKNSIACGTKSLSDYQLKIIQERFPHHQIVISFDNDISGIKSMIKLVNGNNSFKYFKWFSDTKSKDINEFVQNTKNVNAFSDPSFLESKIIDKLMMKMQLMQIMKNF